MRNLLIIFFVLLSFIGFGQNNRFPNKPTQSNIQTSNQVVGQWSGNAGISGVIAADTNALNALPYVKSKSFNIGHTYTDKNTWYRSPDTLSWVLLATTSSNCGGTRLIDGSITWSGTAYNFNATVLHYGIICRLFTSDTATLTVAPADPTYPRIDVFYADTSGQVGIIQGTPSATPIKPSVNQISQIEISFVYVPAGSVTPDQRAIIVYNENIEWASASNIPSINFNYATNPYTGSKSTLIPNAPNGSFVSWQNGSLITIDSVQYLKGWIRLNGSEASPLPLLTISLYSGATQVTNTVTITNGAYGFNATVLNAWQLFVIPTSAFTPISSSTTFDKANFVVTNAPTSFQLDYIYFLSGASVPPVIGNFWGVNGNTGTNPNLNYAGTQDSVRYNLGTNGKVRMSILGNGINETADTTMKILVIDLNDPQRATHWISQPSIFALGCLKIYDSTSAGVTRKYIRDTCSGGSGGSQDLQSVLDIGNYSTTGIQLNTDTAITKATMTFFGDSWTAGLGLPNQSLKWTTLVANYLGYVENNAGLSSSTLMKQIIIDPYGAQNMVDRIPLIPYYSVGDKLVFAYGLNDVRWNGANYTTTNFVTDFTTVIDSAIGRGWSGDNIIFVSTGYIPPTSYVSSGGNPVPTLARQTSFDSCINVLANTYGALYYDAYNFMVNNGARALMQSDSIHPNTQGDKVYAIGFINAYNDPVRIGTQKLAVNGRAEFNNIRLTDFYTTNSQKNYQLVLDSAGNVAASTLQNLSYNNYGNVPIGDNADSIPYRLSVDGSALINDGLNIYNKNATEYNKWLKLFSDFTTGASNIDSYNPTGTSGTLLSINNNSKGNVKIGYIGTGASTIGTGNVVVDSFYTKVMHFVATGFAPTRSIGGNVMYFTGNGTIISSNSGASTFDNLSLQGFGGNTNIGKNGTAGARLDIVAGTATAGTAPLKFNSGTPTTTPEIGAMQFNNGLWIIDSSNSHRDTIATRNWVRNNTSSGGGGTVTSVSGTAGIITSTGGATPIINIDASYTGQTSINTLGTVITGVWNGTAIANANLANSSTTINGTSIALGASGTVTAAAGTLTGTTLNSTVVSSSLTSVGSLSSGAVPASLVTAGTFGTGAYTMATSLNTPTVYGGTGTTSRLALIATTGVGTTGSGIDFKGGNNGATTFATVSNTGAWDFQSGTITTLGNISGNSILAAGQVRAAASSPLSFNGRASIYSSADAVIDFRNNANNAYASTQSLYDRWGSGSPEGVVTAPVGATYHRTDGGANTSFYVKESGSGNTGWVAK